LAATIKYMQPVMFISTLLELFFGKNCC